jgi:hypothetical protein
MKGLTVGALSAGLFLSLAGAAQSYPIISTDWNDIAGSQDDCLARAERAIARNHFKSPGITKTSRHGYRGDYTVVIRCAVSKGFVFFVVTGPDGDVTDKYLTGLKNEF